MKKMLTVATLIICQAATVFASSRSAAEALAYNLVARSPLTSTAERGTAYAQIVKVLSDAGLISASKEQMQAALRGNPQLVNSLKGIVKFSAEEFNPAEIPMEAVYAEQ